MNSNKKPYYNDDSPVDITFPISSKSHDKQVCFGPHVATLHSSDENEVFYLPSSNDVETIELDQELKQNTDQIIHESNSQSIFGNPDSVLIKHYSINNGLKDELQSKKFEEGSIVISDSESDNEAGTTFEIKEASSTLLKLGAPENLNRNSDAEENNLNEEWDEMVRQLDLQIGSQRIIDEDSDDDETFLSDNYIKSSFKIDDQNAKNVSTTEDEQINSRLSADSTQQLRKCVIDLESDIDVSFSQRPIAMKKEVLDDMFRLSGGLEPIAMPLPPVSSQLIDIEMEALALEMSMSERDFMKHSPISSTFEPTDIHFEQGFQQTVMPKRQKVQNIHRSRTRLNYYDNLPLMIDDVLRLLREPLGIGRSLTMFGFNFKVIAIYGRCAPLAFSSGRNPNTEIRRLYEVDDGTASVSVYFNHFSEDRTRLFKELQQVQQKLNASRSKIDKFTYADLHRLMHNIRRNERMPTEREFRLGANVLVLGRPFWSTARNQVQVQAYEMYEDDRNCRDLELAFKANLANMYETRFQLDDVGD